MKFESLLVIIFACILVVLAIYHIFRREWKQLKSLLLPFVLSFLPLCLNALFQIKVDLVSSFLYYGILLFSFTFSITLHALWEVLEYISDCMTHGNAQRWQKRHDSNNHVSKDAIQPAGLVDTMNDLICCIVGAALAVFVWWLLL